MISFRCVRCGASHTGWSGAVRVEGLQGPLGLCAGCMPHKGELMVAAASLLTVAMNATEPVERSSATAARALLLGIAGAPLEGDS